VRNHTEEALFNMALAYWYTGADKYAERFSDIMYSFFLNPATRINPNLNNAQVLSQTYIVFSPIYESPLPPIIGITNVCVIRLGIAPPTSEGWFPGLDIYIHYRSCRQWFGRKTGS
jgi:hypothetical protein